MACSGIDTWTVSSLISIFLKLVLAFILLWVASIVFITARFLGFFGFRLPCSCNDFIQDDTHIDGTLCLHGALIYSIRCYLLSKFPFKWFGPSDIYEVSPSEGWYQLQRASTLPELDELAEEREARKALLRELEEERQAAATAAEETMAMISRIWREKSSVEMEARQFKRMMELKSACDEEAMKVLKETLVRLESEKLRLEEELEMHRRISLGIEDGFCNFDVGRLQMINDDDGDPQNMREETLNWDPELLHLIAEKGVNTAETNLLREVKSGGREVKSGGISPGYEYENPSCNEGKKRRTGLGSNFGGIYENILEMTPCYDMIVRDSAKIKIEDELRHLRTFRLMSI